MSTKMDALFTNAGWLIYEPDVFTVKGCRLAGQLGAPWQNEWDWARLPLDLLLLKLHHYQVKMNDVF